MFNVFHVSARRGPGPGGLRPGAAGRGQLAHLPGPVRPDAAQRGPTPGPALSARLQEPAEPPNPGRDLQPTAVQTGCRVSDTRLDELLKTKEVKRPSRKMVTQFVTVLCYCAINHIVRVTILRTHR